MVSLCNSRSRLKRFVWQTYVLLSSINTWHRLVWCQASVWLPSVLLVAALRRELLGRKQREILLVHTFTTSQKSYRDWTSSLCQREIFVLFSLFCFRCVTETSSTPPLGRGESSRFSPAGLTFDIIFQCMSERNFMMVSRTRINNFRRKKLNPRSNAPNERLFIQTSKPAICFYCLMLSQLPVSGLKVCFHTRNKPSHGSAWFGPRPTSLGVTKLWSVGLRNLEQLLFSFDLNRKVQRSRPNKVDVKVSAGNQRRKSWYVPKTRGRWVVPFVRKKQGEILLSLTVIQGSTVKGLLTAVLSPFNCSMFCSENL